MLSSPFYARNYADIDTVTRVYHPLFFINFIIIPSSRDIQPMQANYFRVNYLADSLKTGHIYKNLCVARSRYSYNL